MRERDGDVVAARGHIGLAARARIDHHAMDVELPTDRAVLAQP